MKIPRTIRISRTVEYSVEWVDIFDNADHMGECHFDTKKILIKKKMSRRATMRTLLHEIIHAMEHTHGFQLKHSLVTELDESFETLLRLNRWFLF